MDQELLSGSKTLYYERVYNPGELLLQRTVTTMITNDATPIFTTADDDLMKPLLPMNDDTVYFWTMMI